MPMHNLHKGDLIMILSYFLIGKSCVLIEYSVLLTRPILMKNLYCNLKSQNLYKILESIRKNKEKEPIV